MQSVFVCTTDAGQDTAGQAPLISFEHWIFLGPLIIDVAAGMQKWIIASNSFIHSWFAAQSGERQCEKKKSGTPPLCAYFLCDVYFSFFFIKIKTFQRSLGIDLIKTPVRPDTVEMECRASDQWLSSGAPMPVYFNIINKFPGAEHRPRSMLLRYLSGWISGCTK